MSEELRCSTCGGSVTINEEKEMYVCDYCGNEFALPVEERKRIELKHQEKLKAETKEKRKEINKKRIKKALVFILALFVISCAALIIYGNSFRIADAHMTIDIGSDNYSNTIHAYAPNINEFRVGFAVRNAPSNTSLYLIWKNKQNVLLKSDIYDISDIKSHIYSAYLSNDQAWDEGEYSVEIYIDDDAEPVDVVNFTVSNNTTNIILDDLHMTSGIKDEVYPIDTVTIYPHSTQQLILTGSAYNAPTDTKMTAVWKHNEEIIDTQTVDLQYTNLYFYRRIKDDHFESGAYSVEIYINDESSPSETVDFSVGY